MDVKRFITITAGLTGVCCAFLIVYSILSMPPSAAAAGKLQLIEVTGMQSTSSALMRQAITQTDPSPAPGEPAPPQAPAPSGGSSAKAGTSGVASSKTASADIVSSRPPSSAPSGSSSAQPASSAAAVRFPVNLNTATQEELMALTGIGEVKAQAILDYRSQNGPFAAIEDVMKVSGIKQATFDKIKDQITVK